MQIELLKHHEHAGTRRSAGAVLTIDDAQGQWLIDLEVARRVSPSSAHSLPSPSPLPISAKPGKPNVSSGSSNAISFNQASKTTQEISK